MVAGLLGRFGRTSLGTAALTIGRSMDNQLALNDMQVSAHHAIIRIEGHTYGIVDIGSTNGTFVNNERIDRNIPRLLDKGDVIRVGQTTLTYEISEMVAIPVQKPASAIERTCPQCSSAIREIAHFCHVCGYNFGILNRSHQGSQIGNYI